MTDFPDDRFETPYYAVIFSSLRTLGDDGYAQTAQRMELAATMPGYLGVESARGVGEDAPGITVSYWQTLDDVAHWKRQAEHLVAQRNGRQRWYSSYRVRVARVERDYGFDT
ncbi:antibiotic biosynthesis monooxygenase [Gordonia sp. TBRC 11910]|uniref:Antibiotic biosynthesis monooxygenase n=1 Tax=Gordonia asplenii TaxID=2725283 RepID=A0A848KV69_9ACTN|nr:antibiotic biosynthesis monooxygenase [Gordonia asplenii]NMO01937.1 antibiotic biosynthesis monooxygenase [Gordonia asplenii]